MDTTNVVIGGQFKNVVLLDFEIDFIFYTIYVVYHEFVNNFKSRFWIKNIITLLNANNLLY